MIEKYTAAQLRHFERYENVRLSGRFNMFDPRARQAAALSKAEFLFILKNYSELQDAIAENMKQRDHDPLPYPRNHARRKE